MKKSLSILLAIAIAALGALTFAQWHKLQNQKTQVASLKGDLDQKSQELTQLQDVQQLLEQQQRDSLNQASELAARLEAKQQAEAKLGEPKVAEALAANTDANSEAKSAGKAKNALGDLFAKLMEDPDTKKMIREQQRMVLDQLYLPLIKQLGLTPEQAAQFKDMLSDNMLKGAEKATSLFAGHSSTNQSEMFNTLAEEQKGFDEQVKAFLGEDRYAQYKDYQLTVGERAQLNQFRQQLTGDNALSDQQTEQLLAFIKEEKQNVSSSTGFPPPGAAPDAGNWQAMLSGEGAEKLLQNQESVNKRVYQRAEGLLSVPQLASLGQFQTNQLQMMRLGFTMARKFMTQGTPEGSSTPPPNR